METVAEMLKKLDPAEVEKKIAYLLGYDPIAEAEKATGLDSHTNELPVWLGMFSGQSKHRQLDVLLSARGDISNYCENNQWLSALEKEGFTLVWRRDFPRRDKLSANLDQPATIRIETAAAFFKPSEGLLLVGETYNGKFSGMNPHCHFNFEFDEGKCWTNWPYWIGISGGMIDRESRVLAGHIYANEGFRFKLAEMRKYGKFLPKWQGKTMLHMKFGEEKDYLPGEKDPGGFQKWMERTAEYERQHMMELPEAVREAIMPEVLSIARESDTRQKRKP